MSLFKQYSASSWRWFNPIWCKYDHIRWICALRQQHETVSLLLIGYNKDARTIHVHVLICRFYMQGKRKRKQCPLICNKNSFQFVSYTFWIIESPSQTLISKKLPPKAFKCPVHCVVDNVYNVFYHPAK